MVRKKSAVLKSSLLVRKGEAEPSAFSASVRPVHGQSGGPAVPAVELAAKDFESLLVRKAESAVAMDRIKNAMSGGATVPFPNSKAEPTLRESNLPASRGKAKNGGGGGLKRPLAGEVIAVISTPRCPKQTRRRALTLRLAPDRYLRLKIFGVYTDRSVQDILTAALDAYLDQAAPSVGLGCPCLNGSTPVAGSA